MKKMIIPILAALVLTGCDGKEKDDLVNLMTEKFKQDEDLADYQIEPEEMAECVVGKILTGVPGFPGSPKRTRYIVAYTRLESVDTAADFQKALDETAEVFGSAEEARKAVGELTMHNFSCIGDLVNANPETVYREDSGKEITTDDAKKKDAEEIKP